MTGITPREGTPCQKNNLGKAQKSYLAQRIAEAEASFEAGQQRLTELNTYFDTLKTREQELLEQKRLASETGDFIHHANMEDRLQENRQKQLLAYFNHSHFSGSLTSNALLRSTLNQRLNIMA